MTSRLLRLRDQPVDRCLDPDTPVHLVSERGGLLGELGPFGGIARVDGGVEAAVGESDLLARTGLLIPA